jgi:hypothetical protein
MVCEAMEKGHCIATSSGLREGKCMAHFYCSVSYRSEISWYGIELSQVHLCQSFNID